MLDIIMDRFDPLSGADRRIWGGNSSSTAGASTSSSGRDPNCNPAQAFDNSASGTCGLHFIPPSASDANPWGSQFVASLNSGPNTSLTGSGSLLSCFEQTAYNQAHHAIGDASSQASSFNLNAPPTASLSHSGYNMAHSLQDTKRKSVEAKPFNRGEIPNRQPAGFSAATGVAFSMHSEMPEPNAALSSSTPSSGPLTDSDMFASSHQLYNQLSNFAGEPQLMVSLSQVNLSGWLNSWSLPSTPKAAAGNTYNPAGDSVSPGASGGGGLENDDTSTSLRVPLLGSANGDDSCLFSILRSSWTPVSNNSDSLPMPAPSHVTGRHQRADEGRFAASSIPEQPIASSAPAATGAFLQLAGVEEERKPIPLTQHDNGSKGLGSLGTDNNNLGLLTRNPSFPLASPRNPSSSKSATIAASVSVYQSRCRVDGCGASLVTAKKYHRKHLVCGMHARCDSVWVMGATQRFCQQCARFHPIEDFDMAKRSCRARLSRHNRRRRNLRKLGGDKGRGKGDSDESDLTSSGSEDTTPSEMRTI